MKKTTFQLSILLTAICCTLLMFSCRQENDITPDKNGELQLQTNEAEYKRLMNARTTYTGTSFEITGVSRTNKLLRIDVEGGCELSGFKLVWDGTMLLSYPAQTRLVLVYEGKTDCKAGLKHTLDVDMEKFFGETNLIVHVANGSKVADVSINPDGSVTNQP